MANPSPLVSPGTTSTGTGTTSAAVANTGVGQLTGQESALSNYVGPYVTDMLAKGQALSETPYEAYGGPLTAGQSDLQNTAFQGIAGLTIPTEKMGAFTPKTFDATQAQNYMNPYLTAALNPQIDEARRQSEIQNLQNRTAATKAGAFGGGRGALMESENQRNLLQNLSGITGKGYSDAYSQAMNQFNVEQGRGQTAQDATNQYGLAALQRQGEAGATQRDIEQQGITADIKEFEAQRDDPLKKVQYQQSLLQGLPLAAQTNSYSQPSALSEILNQSGGLMALYDKIFGPAATTSTTGTTPTATAPVTAPVTAPAAAAATTVAP